MMRARGQGRPAGPLCMFLVLLLWPSLAAAQGNVGTGSLTAALADSEPATGVIDLGPVKLVPGLSIREMGWTDNVFDEAVDPKDDFVLNATPDLVVFSRLRFVKVSVLGAVEFAYMQKYKDERSIGYAGRGRVDLLLSRLRPFIGGGQFETRERANGEVDIRAKRVENEVSGGLAFELSENSLLYGGSARQSTRFEDAFEEGVDVGQTLNRHSTDYNAGMQTDLTPLTTFTLRAGYKEDVFKFEPQRNSNSTYVQGTLTFSPEAAFEGVVTLGVRGNDPVDPLVVPFRGLVANGAVSIPLFEIGRLTLILNRDTEYSFETAEAYYVGLTGTVSYTHRLFGAFDAQVQFAESVFDYGNREGSTERQDRLSAYRGSLGYNLPNRTRIGLNYEFAKRRSPELAERNYDRQRIFLSWMFAF